MTRNRSTSQSGVRSQPLPAGFSRPGGRWLLLLTLLLVLSGSPAAWAQPGVGSTVTSAAPDSTMAAVPEAAAPPASNWTTVWAVLGGVGIGLLGAWLWSRRLKQPIATSTTVASVPEVPAVPIQKKPAENVRKAPPQAAVPAMPPVVVPSAPPAAAPEPPSADNAGKGVSFQSLREVQGTVPKPAGKSAGANKKNKPNFNSRSSASGNLPGGWPAVSPRPATMNPTSPPVPPAGDNQPLETGQTIEWSAPTSTPPAIQELIDNSASPTSEPQTATPAQGAAPAPVTSNGPIHYYAPAPDVPSIEHRKLSPNPLPQMPLLVTLAHAEAATAQYSFSPQADQSRIIGNGVRELKEFFAFELPPTEQFTIIKNLSAGKLEKRDDTWHVVQKATIALS